MMDDWNCGKFLPLYEPQVHDIKAAGLVNVDLFTYSLIKQEKFHSWPIGLPHSIARCPVLVMSSSRLGIQKD